MTREIDHTIRDAWTARRSDDTPLSVHARRWLHDHTGLDRRRPSTRRAGVPEVPASALAPEAAAALREVLGEAKLLTTRHARLGRSGGLSYVDLLRRREAASLPVPDAVALPTDDDTVASVLWLCADHDVAVVPFGGGTSVVGGVRAAAVRGYLWARGVREPCLLILGWESTSDRELWRRRRGALRCLRRFAPVTLGAVAGAAWRHNRFAGPRQRDALLEAGMCAETLETATYWSGLSALREAVREALVAELSTDTHTPVIMCHVSHAYETGASLYFTVLVPRDDHAAARQWERAKAAVCEAISGTARHTAPMGTITHHHAVGVDHAPYLAAEIGDIGLEVLAAVKHTLDPTGIMNPGKLVPGT